MEGCLSRTSDLFALCALCPNSSCVHLRLLPAQLATPGSSTDVSFLLACLIRPRGTHTPGDTPLDVGTRERACTDMALDGDHTGT